MLGAADCPTLLTGTSLNEVLHVVFEDIKKRFPLLNLFPWKKYISETVMTERIHHLLKVASIFSGPRAGEMLSLEQFAANIVKVFFFANAFELKGDDMAALRLPGEIQNQNLLTQEAIVRASNYIRDQASGLHTAQLRRLHLMCCQLLSSSNPTFVVNPDPITGVGVNVTVDFGCIERNAAVDWAVPANDILTDLNTMFDTFRLGDGAGPGTGVNPNLVIVPGRFRSTYLMPNTGIQALIAQTPSIGRLGMPIDLLMRAEDNLKFLPVDDQYQAPVTGVITDAWPIDKICLLRIDAELPTAPSSQPAQKTSSNRVLEMSTARVKGNNYEGGFQAHYFEKNNPESDWVSIEGTAIPNILQPQFVQIWHIT